jgi:hypothetical protein
MLSQRTALAILLAPFALLTLEWSQREEPNVPCGAYEDPAAWLVTAAWWWIAGEASLVSQWAFFAYLLLLPGIPVAVALIAAILIRPSWMLVRVLAWLCAVVLVPGLVGVVDNWGVDFVC